MKKLNSILLCAFFLFSIFSFSQSEVDLKTAKSIAKVNAKALKKAGIKKVMFVEFYGDFVTSKTVAPGVMDSRYGSFYKGTTHEGIEVSDDYYEYLTNEIYESMKQVFIDNGIEVLNKSVLLENEDYVALGLKEEKERREYTGGLGKNSTTMETVRRSVSGMGMWSETLKISAVSKIKKMVPKIATDNGCQAAIITKFRIGLGKKQTPTLEYINSTIDYDIGSYSNGKGRGETYFFKKGGISLFTTNKTLKAPKDLFNEGGEIKTEKYHDAIMKMVNEMTGSYSALIKEELK